MSSNLNYSLRKVKIIATIGPASSSKEKLRELALAGMDIARLNFSHGTHSDHEKVIKALRELTDEIGKPISIMQDLQGPKLRVGSIHKDGIPIEKDEVVLLTSSQNKTDNTAITGEKIIIPFEVPNLSSSLSKGDRILLDDGTIELKVIDLQHDFIEAIVIIGGVVKSHKGVNLPGAELDFPFFTEKDKADLKFGLKQKVDAVALSFIRKSADIQFVRQFILEEVGSEASIPLIAKLECPEAITDLENIVVASDGVMVARGDLAVETSPAAVPIIQKKIIELANHQAKLVITATQMLESMIYNPRPTRAEASDVANAVFDGTDAIMLSGETAVGKYPVETIRMMDGIVREAESHAKEWGFSSSEKETPTLEDAVSITRAARELAHDRNVAIIAVFTESGKTALLMSKARPNVPIMAFTPIKETFQRLPFLWGVIPILSPFTSTVENMLTQVEAGILSSRSIEPGQQVIIISGFPVGEMRPPNFTLLHTIQNK
ncbi:MAG: pyruvate kinase [Anaerolineaceae bacterium]|nr:pyruvate kinase [Anaerolineaceae bacterium]